MSLFISPHIRRLIDMALDEDQVGLDVTSQIFFAGAQAQAHLVAKAPLVVAGMELVQAVYTRVDPAVTLEVTAQEGALLEPGDELARLAGPAASLLIGERVALNFLQRMSGIATKTAAMVRALDNPDIRLVDTRKTMPGWRELDKYAVRCGGGHNHRMSLAGGIMLKDNHIAAAGGDIAAAVARVRRSAPHTLRVEIEVTDLDQVDEALEAGCEIIMLDNMSTEQMRLAAERIRAADHPVTIEVSGNVTRERLPELGELDVDVISSGALTHSVLAADISMKFALTQEEPS